MKNKIAGKITAGVAALSAVFAGSALQQPEPVLAAALSSTVPIILDVDTGRDDAWTIIGAMDEYEIRAIVTSYGNIPSEKALANTLSMVSLAERSLTRLGSRPPVWRGEAQPLTPDNKVANAELARREKINGNGLCDLLRPHTVRAVEESTSWADDIRVLLQTTKKTDYIICGPLTNLARLIDNFEAHGLDIRDYINRIVVMGGSFDSAIPVDFNFKADPVAAQKVIALFKDKVTLVPFDETKKLKLTLPEIYKLSATDKAAEFCQELMVAHAKGWSADNSILLHDPATLFALDNAGDTIMQKVKIVQNGELSGKIIEDPQGTPVRRFVIAPGAENHIRTAVLQKIGLRL